MPSPIRVALDVSAVPRRLSGAGRYVWHLAGGLGALSGVELALLARRGDGARWRGLAPAAEVLEVAPSPRPFRLLHQHLGLARKVGAIGPDVYHGPHYTLPTALPVPGVVTIHDLTFFDRPDWHEPSKVAYFRRAMHSAVRRAAVIVAISDHTAARLRSVLEPKAAVVVIPLGVDTERFRPDPSPDDPSHLRALGVVPPYILFVGTVEPRKNVPSLVRAFARVRSVEPGHRLVIAGLPGWGGADAEVRRAIRESNVEGAVDRLGYVPEDALAALIRGAKALVYPSREEGFGLPPLEALACGTPAVVSRGTAMERILGDAAYLADPEDLDELSEVISSAASAGSDSARVARGVELARAHSWGDVARRHEEAYRMALRGHRAGV